MKSKYQGARAQTKQMLSSEKIMVMEDENKKKTLIILLLLFIAGTSSCSDDVKFCVFDDDEDPSSVQQRLEQKLRTSDVVLAGYTRHEYSRESEFLVLNVFKGEQKVAGLFQNRKLSALESALNRRLVNVTGFVTDAEPECNHDIKIGETYLLFAKFASKLILDGADAIQAYSKGKEEEVKKLMQIIGATKSIDGDQSEWSTCSKSCGGGIQVKRSSCTGRSPENCSPTVSGIQRSCNTFPCIGLTDVLEIVGLRQSPRHQEDRPAAYRIASNSSWNSTAPLPAGGFPAQFSLMIAIRSEKEPAPGFLFRLLQNGRNMQVAVHLSKDTVSLILPDGLYVRFKQENKLKHGSWQWMSFSIRRNTVTFFLDCKPSGVLPATIDEDSRKLTGLAEYVVGSIGNRDRSFFRGEVEQILFSEAPSAAAEQCSVLEQPLEHVSSMSSSSETFDVDVDKRVSFPKKTAGTSISTKQDDEDFDFNNDVDGSGSFYDDEYDDDDEEEKQGTDIRKAVLLLSESPDKDDDEDIDENNDLNNFLHNKIREDVDQEEEEDYDDDDEEEETGSGFASSTKALPEWTDWSECSRTCDWGVRSRTLITPCTTLDDDETCTTAQPQQQQSEPCFKMTCPPPTTTVKPKVTRKKVTRKDYSSKPLPSSRNSWAKIGGSRVTATTRTGTEYQRFSNKYQTVKTDSANCKPICQNGGTCSTFGSRCICKKGFFGRYCEKAACDGLCENGGICAQHGRCLCLPGFYGIRCEFRKCNLVAVKRPYEKSFKKKIVKEENFPCGAWGWKKCSRKKVYYAPVFQTFYRTEYVCDIENLVPSEETHQII